MKVDIYWNLHRNCYSVRCRGKVIGHARWVSVVDAQLVVNLGGWRRVQETKRKNVHAFVRGRLARAEWLDGDTYRDEDAEVAFGTRHGLRYNPYEGPWFQRPSGRPIHTAPEVQGAIEDGRPRLVAIGVEA